MVLAQDFRILSRKSAGEARAAVLHRLRGAAQVERATILRRHGFWGPYRDGSEPTTLATRVPEATAQRNW